MQFKSIGLSELENESTLPVHLKSFEVPEVGVQVKLTGLSELVPNESMLPSQDHADDSSELPVELGIVDPVLLPLSLI